MSAPFAALRAGLAERLELLVFVPSWSRRSATGGSESGFGDLSVGARGGFAPGRVRVAALALLTLPTGAEGFSGPTTLRGGLAAESAVGEATAFATGLVAVQERDDRLAGDLELSAGLSRAIAEGTSGFVEGYLQTRGRARDGGGARVGLTRLLGDDIQLDLYGGIDLVSPTTPVGGAGLSIRW
ncbi:MAG: transporter [Gemmatimonadales bacterium]